MTESPGAKALGLFGLSQIVMTGTAIGHDGRGNVINDGAGLHLHGRQPAGAGGRGRGGLL
jgi:hypothetical protein